MTIHNHLGMPALVVLQWASSQGRIPGNIGKVPHRARTVRAPRDNTLTLETLEQITSVCQSQLLSKRFCSYNVYAPL